MATFEIETNKVTAEINEVVEVEVQSFPKIAKPIDYTFEASVQPESYAIIPTNLMGETGNLSDTVLAAIEAAYDAQLDPGGTLYLILDGLQSSIDVAQTGVNQNVGEINTLNSNVSTLETTVVSRLDTNEASILALQGSVAAIDYSQAYIVNSINSAFGGDLTAYIGTIASTYVDANSAIAADLSLLEVSIGNNSASVTRLDEAIIDTQVSNPAWIDDGIQTDPDAFGNPRYLTEARAKSSLTVDANGHIAGFVAESDGLVSRFDILADQFYITNATTGAQPFSIVGTDVQFNGIVNFTATNVAGGFPGTTTINGGLVTTNTLDADRLTTNQAWINGFIVSSSFDGNHTGNIGTPTTGFRLSSNTAGTFADPSIYGAYIRGGDIYGTNITGSTIEGNTISGNTLFYDEVQIKTEGYVSNTGKMLVDDAIVGYNNSTATVYTYSKIFVGRSTGTGLHNDRICKSNQTFMLHASMSANESNSLNVSIEVSVNGGAYTNLFTIPAVRITVGDGQYTSGSYGYIYSPSATDTLYDIKFRISQSAALDTDGFASPSNTTLTISTINS